jgi:hypothetical protein
MDRVGPVLYVMIAVLVALLILYLLGVRFNLDAS